MKYCSLSIIAVFFAVTLSFGSDKSAKIATVGIVQEAPAIDGRVDDKVWKGVEYYAGFTDRFGKMPAKPDTKFKIVTDKKYLYILIELQNPDNRKGYDLKNRGCDKVDFRHETIELFVAPSCGSDSEYYHFALEPGGTNYDNVSGGAALDFNSGWCHAVGISDKYWFAEIAIPLSKIGFSELLDDGACFAFNICRTTSGPIKYQTWTPTGQSFHNPNTLAEAVVGSFKQAADRILKEIEKAASPEILKSEEMASLSCLAKQVNSLENWKDFRVRSDNLWLKIKGDNLKGDRLITWKINPWRLPGIEKLPTAQDKLLDKIYIDAFQGEYGVYTFAIALPSNTKLLSQIRVVPGRINRKSLKANRGPALKQLLTNQETKQAVPIKDHLQIYDVCEISLAGAVRRDVLKKIRFEDTLAVPARGNGVVWLSYDTKGLAPGLWTTEIELRPLANQQIARTIPFSIRILPAKIPSFTLPYVIAWVSDVYRPRYIRGFFGGRSSHVYDTDVYIKELKKDKINALLIEKDYLGLDSIKYDKNGRIENKIDLSGLGKWIKDFGTEKTFYILMLTYTNLPEQLGGGGNPGQIQKENFRYFASKVGEYFEKHNITTDRFAWYLMDEPREKESVEQLIEYGKLLKEAAPKQQRLATIYSGISLQAIKQMSSYINLWVVKLSLTTEQQNFIDSLDRKTNRIFSYMVYGRNTRPLQIRAMGVESFLRGYEGIGIWSYGEQANSFGTSTWDDDSGINGRKYALIYEGEKEPVSSVRREAFRMGIQDYRFLEWATRLAMKHHDTPMAKEIDKKLNRMKSNIGRSNSGKLTDIIKSLRPLVFHMTSGASAKKED